MMRRVFALMSALSLLLFVALVIQRQIGAKWHYEWSVTKVPFSFAGATATSPATLQLESYDLIYLDPDNRRELTVRYWQALLLTIILPILWLTWRVWPKRSARGFPVGEIQRDLSDRCMA